MIKELLDRLEEDLSHPLTIIKTGWLIGIMIVLQIPTWIALFQIWSVLITIAGKLPK